MAASPEKTVFLESVSTGMQGHTSQWIADDIDRVIGKYSQTNFAGAVTDNTSANKAAWEILKDRHPTMFFHGCVSHGLHLLMKDIFAAKKQRNQVTWNQVIRMDTRLKSCFNWLLTAKI